MVHRYLAAGFVVILGAVVLEGWRRRKDLRWAAPVAIGAAVLYSAQVLAGALNVWYAFPDWLTVAHTTIAASIWFVLTWSALLAFYASSAARQKRAIPRVEVHA